MATITLDPVSLPPSEAKRVRAIRQMLHGEGKARLVGKGGKPAMELPDAVYELLLRILSALQEGKAVSVVPYMQQLTTQEAAAMLGMSRPFLVGLLESGKLPFHLTGTHRRVYLRDLIAFKERRDRGRRKAIERMGEVAEREGVYDRVLLPDE